MEATARTYFDASIEAKARRQHDAFTRRQALEMGFTPDAIRVRVRGKRWRRVAKGVYVLAGSKKTYKQRVMIAVLQAGPGSFASHRCAARLRELDGVTTAPVEITVPRRLRAKPAGVRIHYSTDCTVFDWSEIDGIPVATVTRIIVDLAADKSASLGVLERIFECGQRRGETSHAMLREMVQRLARPGKRGIRRARALTAVLLDDGQVNHSDLETRFFQLLRRAGLPLPRRQRVVHRPDGRFAYADYAYDELDAHIELLGYRWHSSSDALTHDVERNNDIALQRTVVLQFTWSHVTRRPAYVLDKVRALFATEGAYSAP